MKEHIEGHSLQGRASIMDNLAAALQREVAAQAPNFLLKFSDALSTRCDFVSRARPVMEAMEAVLLGTEG